VPGRRERRLRPDEGEGERREQRGEDWTVHELLLGGRRPR
jgi:hypothetical protein